MTSLLLRDSLQGRDRSGLFTATATGPVRYDDAGLIIEPAVTNAISNPVVAISTNNWFSSAEFDVARVTTLPAPLPEDLAGITTAYRVTANQDITGSLSIQVASMGGTWSSAGAHTNSVYIYVPTAFGGTAIELRNSNFTGSSQTAGTTDLGVRDDWQRVIAGMVLDAGDLTGSITLRMTSGTMLTGQQLWIVGAQSEPGTVATSLAVGDMGPGYAWGGTAHNSVSTRAETGLTIPHAGHISALRGALVARVRLNDAPSGQRGIIRVVLYSGTAGSDLLALNRATGATSPRFQSRSNGGSFISANAIGALSVGQRAAVWGVWTEGTIAAAVGTDGLVSAARDVPAGTFGSNDIQIGRESAGSTLLSGLLSDLLIYDAPLSDARRAIVLDALDNEATEDELWGLFAGNPYTFFQLRPY